LTVKEKAANSSGPTQQDIAAKFNAELDQIYDQTKQIIVDENKGHTEITDLNLPSIFQETEMEKTVTTVRTKHQGFRDQ